jgi:hypothetical protein
VDGSKPDSATRADGAPIMFSTAVQFVSADLLVHALRSCRGIACQEDAPSGLGAFRRAREVKNLRQTAQRKTSLQAGLAWREVSCFSLRATPAVRDV